MNVTVCVGYNRTIVEGPPGTGKTTFLLDQVDNLLKQNIDIESIGFFSFTKKAAQEARTRAIKKFNLNPEKFRYFQTLHSLAHSIAKGGPNKFFDEEEQKLFCIKNNLSYKPGDTSVNTMHGSSIINLINRAKNRMISLEKQYHDTCPPYPYPYLKRVCATYETYKKKENFFDHADSIINFNFLQDTPILKALFIDEAQDLNNLQCEMTTLMEKTAEHTWYAGDDDQAIYKWSGANPYFFIKLTGNVVKLTKSHRVPKAIAKLAKEILPRIKTRRNKDWYSKAEEGSVHRHMYFSTLPIIEELEKDKKTDQKTTCWYILSRNGYQLDPVKAYLKSEGVWYGNATKEKGGSVPAVGQRKINAIYIWEGLKKGKKLNFEEVENLYEFIRSLSKNSPEDNGITWGYKSYKTFDQNDTEKTYNYDELVEKHGLKVNIKYNWYEILQQLTNIEIEYIRACRRRGEKLMSTPRVILSTIHSIKGGEADHVALFTEINQIQHDSIMRGDDDEHRVFYVALTRAKKSLHLLESEKQWAYQI